MDTWPSSVQTQFPDQVHGVREGGEVNGFQQVASLQPGASWTLPMDEYLAARPDPGPGLGIYVVEREGLRQGSSGRSYI